MVLSQFRGFPLGFCPEPGGRILLKAKQTWFLPVELHTYQTVPELTEVCFQGAVNPVVVQDPWRGDLT
jgi:hypothetical protein